MIGPVAFLAPWLLLGFAALPVLWWLLRAVPPAPGRKAFPGVRLLLGLKDPEKMPERTPWWLLLLRMTALAAAILAFAGPVLNPRPESSGAPLLVLVDGGWGDAPHWAGRMDRAAGALAEAARDGRRAAVVTMTTPPVPGEALPWRAAPEWSERLAGLSPRPWAPDRAAWAAWLADRDEPFETLWLSDGIGHGGEEALARALLAHGPVTLAGPPATALALTPPALRDGALTVEALRADAGAARPVAVVALGPDPTASSGRSAPEPRPSPAGEKSVTLALDMPMELRNRVGRIQLAAGKSAASVVLADDTVRRRKVGLMSGRPEGEAQDLVDPLHYLRSALQPFAEVIEAPLPEMLNAAPDVLVLADVGTLGDAEHALLVPWVEKGGLLIRFAGPRLAQSGAGQLEDDPLLPVRLRAGGRSIGGAMSWGAPRRLKPFPDNGPFAGLARARDVDISSQVMAQPDPDLPDRVMATLEDGRPRHRPPARRRPRRALPRHRQRRLVEPAALRPLRADARAPDPERRRPLDRRRDPRRLGVDAAAGALRLRRARAAEPRRRRPRRAARRGAALARDPARHLRAAATAASRSTSCAPATASRRCRRSPTASSVETLDRPEEVRLGPWLVALALVLLAIDVVATLVVSGRLGRRFRAPPPPARRRSSSPPRSPCRSPAGRRTGTGPDADFIYAANETVLAYVETGNPRVDAVSAAGLAGLSRVLFDRTAIEPADPVAVDIETHDLSLYPFLYWPVTDSQVPPSDAAVARLNDYLRFGGMILFDTQDADLGGSMGGTTPNGRALQRIAARLDVPPLEPIPSDHVLTRTFYLLQDFPGRWTSGPLWVEASPEAEDGRGHALPQPQRRGDARRHRLERLGLGLGDAGERPADVPGRPRHRRRAPARDGAAVRDQPHHVCHDRQLQIRSGARARPPRPAGAVGHGRRRLRSAPAAAGDRRPRRGRAPRRRRGAVARADRLVAARARRARAPRRARRAVAAPRGPDAGAEHRHRRRRRQRLQPHRRPRPPARRRRSTGSRPGSTASARAAGSRSAPSTSPTAARTGPSS